MSYLETLQQHNASLQSLIDTANNLPEAGSSSGGSVETCTVSIYSTDLQDDIVIYYTTISESGSLTPEISTYPFSTSLSVSIVAVKNSFVTFRSVVLTEPGSDLSIYTSCGNLEYMNTNQDSSMKTSFCAVLSITQDGIIEI